MTPALRRASLVLGLICLVMASPARADTVSGMLTPAASQMFSAGLNLDQFGHLEALARVTDWGVITVPEASTSALMGLGLLGMGLVARRRKAEGR